MLRGHQRRSQSTTNSAFGKTIRETKGVKMGRFKTMRPGYRIIMKIDGKVNRNDYKKGDGERILNQLLERPRKVIQYLEVQRCRGLFPNFPQIGIDVAEIGSHLVLTPKPML